MLNDEELRHKVRLYKIDHNITYKDIADKLGLK